MFGQQSSNPFGSPPAASNASSPFGAPAAFGSPAPAPFGGFGSGAAGGAAFGTPAPTGFGSTFGAPAPAPTGFGGGFGASSGMSFGSTGTTNTSPFGAPAPAPTGGLFGASQAPAGSLFGGGGFGATTANTAGGFGGFGSTASTPTTGSGGFGAPSTFGAPAPASSGGLFGSAAPAPAFGAPAPSSSLFGAPAPAPGGGLFGAPAPAPTGGLFGAPSVQQGAAGGAGTKLAPYQATSRPDGTSSILLQSITAMQQYENKSFEELRYEDYMQGNKGDGSGTAAGGFGGFGASAPAPTGGFGLFGNTAPAPAPFGATGTSTTTFGTPSLGTFGAPSSSGGFGAPAPAASGAFSFGSMAPAPAFGGFGTAAKPPSSGLFGSAPTPAPGSIFGSPPAPAPTGGLFGSAPAPPAGSLFGSSPSPAPGLFGAPAPAPSTGGLFGSAAPAPGGGGLFGAPPPGGGGLFGAPAPAPTGGGLFGAPGPAFGSPPAAPTSLFGAPASSPSGGLFGKPPSTSLFGTPAPALATGGFFGGPPAPAPSMSYYGAPSPSAPPQGYGYPMSAPVTVIPPAADAVLAQQLAAVENQRKELEKLEVWRGHSPRGASVIPSSLSEPDSTMRILPYSATSNAMIAHRPSPKSSAKLRPRGFGPVKPTTPSMALTGNTSPHLMSPDAFMSSSTKRLVIKPGAPRSAMRLRLVDVARDQPNTLRFSSPQPEFASPLAISMHSPSPGVTSPPMDPVVITNGGVQSPTMDAFPYEKESSPMNGSGYDFYQQVIAPQTEGKLTSPPAATDRSLTSMVPKLTKPEYSVMPTLERLATMSEADLATVSGFTVTRGGFGSVAWDGAVDVRGVDLDRVVCIENRDVAVYYSEEADGTKPPVGSKLNRSAVITLFNVFPKQGVTADEDTKEKFERKIAKATKKMDADLVSYDSSTGIWKFRVHHFSRYGLFDDSDDEEYDADMVTEQASLHFESGERGGRSPDSREVVRQMSPRSTSRFSAPINEDEEMSEEDDDANAALVSDVESGGKDSSVLRAAEDAYMMLFETRGDQDMAVEPEPMAKVPSADLDFQDESEFNDDYMLPRPMPPGKVNAILLRQTGICARIARKCGIRSFTVSNIDYGMRMGRSFRVGWRPDGSFLHLQSGPGGGAVVLRQSKPVFVESIQNEDQSMRLLQTHLKHASKLVSSGQAPTFTLFRGVHGSPSSWQDLCNALAEYEQVSEQTRSVNVDQEEGSILMRAFSLLSSLAKGTTPVSCDSNELTTVDSSTKGKTCASKKDERVIELCRKWLTSACEVDVRNDLRDALDTNNTLSAIFTAVAGGDVEQAASLATKHGHLHLATLLAAFPTGGTYIHEQVQRWHESGAAACMPASVLRIYTILGGDLDVEEQIYHRSREAGTIYPLDWRRRLCMLLTYGSRPDKETTMASLLDDYGDEVANGFAPYASPRYARNFADVQGNSQCLLYKLLHLAGTIGGDNNFAISDLVSPLGYTVSRFDCSGAFHLAAVLSALGSCRELSPLEEATLLDTYAAQLVVSGKWDCAVYVMLCTLRNESSEDRTVSQLKAKHIVLQNFGSQSDPTASMKRKKLETMGVPSEWFEEALAYRCAHAGNAYEYVKHLSAFSAETARLALEELLIPNLLFKSRDDIVGIMELLGLFASEENSLAATVLDFFQLSEDVRALSRMLNDRKSDDVSSLLGLAGSVEDRLTTHRALLEMSLGTSCGLRVFPCYDLVPQTLFLAEALAGVSFLRLQLMAMQGGNSVFDEQDFGGTRTGCSLKVASQLAFMAAKGENGLPQLGTVYNESMLSGLI